MSEQEFVDMGEEELDEVSGGHHVHFRRRGSWRGAAAVVTVGAPTGYTLSTVPGAPSTYTSVSVSRPAIAGRPVVHRR